MNILLKSDNSGNSFWNWVDSFHKKLKKYEYTAIQEHSQNRRIQEAYNVTKNKNTNISVSQEWQWVISDGFSGVCFISIDSGILLLPSGS